MLFEFGNLKVLFFDQFNKPLYFMHVLETGLSFDGFWFVSNVFEILVDLALDSWWLLNRVSVDSFDLIDLVENLSQKLLKLSLVLLVSLNVGTVFVKVLSWQSFFLTELSLKFKILDNCLLYFVDLGFQLRIPEFKFS